MIEVYITKNELQWDVMASILPYGGLGLARDSKLASINDASFSTALRAIGNVSKEPDFIVNAARWPVSGPKFLIINEMSHPDHGVMGNYRVEVDGIVIGAIKDFPRANRLELIKKALEIVLTNRPLVLDDPNAETGLNQQL